MITALLKSYCKKCGKLIDALDQMSVSLEFVLLNAFHAGQEDDAIAQVYQTSPL